jgi:hypothetical protein
MKADPDIKATVTHTIIPCEPGWYLCIRYNDDAGGYVDEWGEEPIVAWEIELHVRGGEWADTVSHFVTPITLFDNEPQRGHHAIKRPDGIYYTQCGAHRRSVGELNQYYIEVATAKEDG